VGALLCVLGWYQASGQPTVPQQIPYLASATIPGAALLAAGAAALLRPAAARAAAPGRTDQASPAGRPTTGSGARAPFLRVPDGRYLHTADCPLMDARADAVALERTEAAGSGLLPCPLCHAGAEAAKTAEATEATEATEAAMATETAELCTDRAPDIAPGSAGPSGSGGSGGSIAAQGSAGSDSAPGPAGSDTASGPGADGR
jgi:hypothetical protein